MARDSRRRVARTAIALAPIAIFALACAGRAAPSTQLSREPRGTDLSLLPAAVAMQERPATLALQLTKPAYITIFEWPEGSDSLRVVYSSLSDSTARLDGTATVRIASPTRQVLSSDRDESLVRESCVVVQRNVGDRGVPICGSTPANLTAAPRAAWRFVRPLILLATSAPYRGASVITPDWFLRLDGMPPSVTDNWGALPLGAPMLARKR